MLEKTDLERVFNAAARKGFIYADLFCEHSLHSRLSINGKVEEVRIADDVGIALRCFDGKKTKHFFCNGSDVAPLLRRLSGELADDAPLPARSAESREGKRDENSAEHFQILKTLSRDLRESNERARFHSIVYEDRRTWFEVANSEGEIARGADEDASFTVDWSVIDRPLVTHHSSDHGTEIAPFIRTLAAGRYLPVMAKNTTLETKPWPAPQGELPILWSPRAFGKLCLYFLRAFEGDLVLGNASFLSQLELPLDLAFSLEESPAAEGLVDHEGSPRKGLTLFSKGRPRGLACNHWVASQLSVDPTGHGRRQSFRKLPTTGLWSPAVKPDKNIEPGSLLGHLAKGLSVHDVEILKFNPATAEMRLRLTTAYLIHHGEEGERIASLDIDANLVEILRSAIAFSSESERVGIRVQKQNQNLITEISCPEVLSLPLVVPGEVPASHYW